MAVTPTAHDRRLRRQRAVSRGSPQHPRSYRRWTTHSLSSTVHTYAVAGLHLHVVCRCPRGPPPHTGFSSWPSTSTFRVRVRPLHRRLERRGHHGYHPRRWHLRAAARCACPTTSSRSATTRRTGRALWGDGEKFEVTRNEAARACAWGDCIREETAEQRSTGCGWPEWEAEASPIQL